MIAANYRRVLNSLFPPSWLTLGGMWVGYEYTSAYKYAEDVHSAVQLLFSGPCFLSGDTG